MSAQIIDAREVFELRRMCISLDRELAQMLPNYNPPPLPVTARGVTDDFVVAEFEFTAEDLA